MPGGYTDIDDMLATDTRVPVTFKVTSTGLGGALDPGADEVDVGVGARLELPLWLVRNLATRGFVSLHMPACYGDSMRRRLRAGARVEDLRTAGPFYYDVAEALTQVHAAAGSAGIDSGAGPLDATLPAFVAQTFQQRYKELLIKSYAKGDAATNAMELSQRLSAEENALFQASRAAAAAAERWRNSELLSSRPRPVKRKTGAAGLGTAQQ